MEVVNPGEYIYSDAELDRTEGQVIEDVKASSQESLADPDAWLDEELKRNVLVTSVDWVINWGQR
ncbi:NADH-quinone oxidoreductase subunit B, partial [Chloroflexota bacterium]